MNKLVWKSFILFLILCIIILLLYICFGKIKTICVPEKTVRDIQNYEIKEKQCNDDSDVDVNNRSTWVLYNSDETIKYLMGMLRFIHEPKKLYGKVWSYDSDGNTILAGCVNARFIKGDPNDVKTIPNSKIEISFIINDTKLTGIAQYIDSDSKNGNFNYSLKMNKEQYKLTIYYNDNFLPKGCILKTDKHCLDYPKNVMKNEVYNLSMFGLGKKGTMYKSNLFKHLYNNNYTGYIYELNNKDGTIVGIVGTILVKNNIKNIYVNNTQILSISYNFLNTEETYDGDIKLDKIYSPQNGVSKIGYTYTYTNNNVVETVYFFFQCFTSLKGDKCCLSGKCD